MISPVVRHLADLIEQANPPEIREVTVSEAGTLTATMMDGSAVYVLLARQAPSTAPVPPSPWPPVKVDTSSQGRRR